MVGGFPGQRKYDPHSNIYNPGWRDHPNLSYGARPLNFQIFQNRQSGAPQQTNSTSGTYLKDMFKAFMSYTQQFKQETRSSIQNLENQVNQIASSISILEFQGRLPSQPVVNPTHNVSAITLRNGKKLRDPNKGSKEAYVQNQEEMEKEVIPPQPEVDHSEEAKEDMPNALVTKTSLP